MVRYELVKQLQWKYLSVRKLKNDGKYVLVRFLLGYKLALLDSSVEKYGGWQDGWKYYFDLASWKDMPCFSFDPKKRKGEKEEFTTSSWKKHFCGYDYAIDLDSKKGAGGAWGAASEIKTFFDKNKIPYSVKFSGSKGFHFIIPHRFLSDITVPMELPALCSRMTGWLSDRLNLKTVKEGGVIDDSIYDHKRILKLAYSLDGENVALPLNDHQFGRFNIANMHADMVWNHTKVYNRGLLLRTHSLSDLELRRNVGVMFQHAKNYMHAI